MIKNIYRSIIFLLLLSCIQLDAEGVIAGMLVVTPQGLQCIEELSVGDIVTCYDFRTSRSTQQKITHVNHHTSNHLMQLTINGDMLLVDVHQRVYLPIEQRWCQAKNLSPGNIILASIDNILYRLTIDDVKVVDDAYETYEFTVPVYHNFYISKHGIITHNIIAIAPAITPLLTFAATTTATIATKILAVFSFFCASPIALTSTQATVAAAATAISVGGSMLHDSYKARRAQQSSEQKQGETRTPENNSYTIRVHDNLYTCKEKLGMPSMSERVHLNLGPEKPGPTCPSHNPTKTVTYYDAKGNLLTGKQLAMVKKEDLARRQAVRDWRLPPPLPPLLPIQQPDIMPNTCPVSTETKERKEPSISTCPAAPDTKEPTSACGLQQSEIPALSKQSCSPSVEEQSVTTPCNTSQISKVTLTKNVETKLPKSAIKKHSHLRDNAVKATTQSTLGTVVEDAKATASLPVQQEDKKIETGKIKTVDDILVDTQSWKKQDFCKQFVKGEKCTIDEGYAEALKDFASLELTDVQVLPNNKVGKIGTLPDGRTVVVRRESSAECPTLEIQKIKGTQEKSIKIRYGQPKY